MIFRNMSDLRAAYPGPAITIDRDNALQYPNAKFVVGGFFVEVSGDEKDESLHVFFDVGTPESLLWVWVCGDLNDPVWGRGSYIDEYYEIPISDAVSRYPTLFVDANKSV